MIRMQWECRECGGNCPCRLVELMEHPAACDPVDCPRDIQPAFWKKVSECEIPDGDWPPEGNRQKRRGQDGLERIP